MRKIYGFLALCVVLAGCKPIEYEVQDNRIRVTGVSGEEIGKTIQRMFNSYHWTGAGTSHISRTSTVNFEKTKEIIRKLSAVTDEGLLFSVEILEKNKEPVLVTIHSDPKSKYTTQTVIAQLLEKLNSNGVAVSAKTYPRIRISDLVGNANSSSFSGNWLAEGNWKSRVQTIPVYIEKNGNSSIQYTLDRRSIPEFSADGMDAQDLPLDFTATTPAGKMQFTGNREAVSSSACAGTVVLDIDSQYFKKIQSCVKESITDDQMLRLFFYSLDADYAEQVVKAMGEKQSLPDLFRLKNYQIEPTFIEAVYAAGYKLGIDELTRVKNYQLSPKFMADFKEAGYDFAIDQLIRIKNYQMDAATFKTFKDAGYDFTIDEQIRAKNYQIPASFAAQLKKMGCNYSLDELIHLKNYQLSAEYIGAFKDLGCDYSIDELTRLKNYQVTPDYVEAFQKIGYPLSVKDLINARNYQVRPGDLKKYADAGYTFTLDETIKLRNYSVPMDFILGVKQEGFENFTADELIRFRQKNISAEDIRKIRSTSLE